MNYHANLDAIEDNLDDAQMQMVRDAERRLVDDHTGGVVLVPTAIVHTDLDDTISALHNSGVTDYGEARRFVVARSMANCVTDRWNPQYQPDE